MLNACVGELAAQQGGHIHHSQLTRLGLSRRAIQHRVAIRYLIRVYHDVYAVGHVPSASADRAHGALLAVRGQVALAGWSAVNAYQNAIRWVEPFTVVTGSQSDPAGVNVLHSRQLTDSDIRAVQNGLRAVTPALAVRQVSGDVSPPVLIRTIDDFRVDHRTRLTHEELVVVVDRFPRGSGPLRAVLDHLQPEPTRSPWEQDWPVFAVEQNMPAYEMNVHVLTYRVDVLLDGCVVLMFDGWSLHGSRHAFERDRAEANEITAATGRPVLRITYRQFRGDPQGLARQILAVHARERQRRTARASRAA